MSLYNNEYVKDLMRKHLMTLDQALKLASPSIYNRNMIKALQMLVWQNTEADEKRLVAAIIVEKNKHRIFYDGPKNGHRVRK